MKKIFHSKNEVIFLRKNDNNRKSFYRQKGSTGGNNCKYQLLRTFAGDMASKTTNKIRIQNKRANREYFLLEKYVAGIVLTGTEIKSIRNGKANLSDAYCVFENGELFVRAMHISEYKYGTYNNHLAKRDRKLLLTARELKKLNTKVKEKGFTIVPTVLFINDKGLAKLEIALARGKHSYDKREDLKKRDIKREIDRHMKR